jgi:putative ABC transport system permease protein
VRVPLSLILLNLLAHPVRTLLTLASLIVAVFLIVFLETVVSSLDAGIEAASADRLVVQSAVSLFVNLPESYQSKIEAVPGVSEVAKWQWFGGIYQEPGNFFAQFGVDAERLLRLYPEFELVDGSAETFVRERDACLIGTDLAERYGFKVGDTVPLIGTIFPRTDGGAWEFRVAGIYRSKKNEADNGTLFFHFTYLAESLEAGASGGPPGVGVYIVGVERGAAPETIMRRVDELFENGPQRVQTTTEGEFGRQFVTMLGNIPAFLGSIGGGVLFAILLAALNTMLMAARERTHEIGVLKAMGFSDGSLFGLFLAESIMLCGLGGVLGLCVAFGVEPLLKSAVGSMLPGLEFGMGAVVHGLGLSLLIGVLAGLVPAFRARSLIAVDALRAV